MAVIDEFKTSHARIEAVLQSAEKEPAKLGELLRGIRAEVINHFKRKDEFYVALAAQCDKAKDAGAAQLTRIFESNMKVQSAAVVRFFETLDTQTGEAMASGFKTMAAVIRQRFGTEEKAVFPLFVRTLPKTEGA